MCLFADDTSISVSGHSREEVEVIVCEEAGAVSDWFSENKLIVNNNKTQIVAFKIRNSQLDDGAAFLVCDEEIATCHFTKFLGINIDQNLNFSKHIDDICKKISKGIFVLKSLATFAKLDVLLSAYYGMIYPYLTYAVEIWGHECVRSKFILKLQKRAIRVIFRKPHRFSCKFLFSQYKILTFPSIYILQTVKFVHKNLPLFNTSQQSSHQYNLRERNSIIVPKHRTHFYETHLIFNGVRLYNALPAGLKDEDRIKTFENKVKKLLLERCYYSVGEFLGHTLVST